MIKSVKICFCIILMAIKAFAMEPCYVESNLGFSSRQFGVTFFNNHDARIISNIDNTIIREGYYTTAVVYGSQERIEGLSFKKFENGPLHYLCLDREENYKDLQQLLDELNRGLIQSLSCSSSTLFSRPSLCVASSLESLYSYIRDSQTVCITFGAGISAGYVPTLIGFFEVLNLEKVPSEDKATDDSIIRYISKLFREREHTIEITQKEWLKVVSCNIDTTPAHTALKSLIDLLKEKGKDVFVYTDNIDGIHQRSNIQLSELHVPEEQMTKILYPPLEKMCQKKIAVLACGQSFDFHGVLSTINTRINFSQEASFFSLNINSNSIGIYEGLDVDIALDSSESIDISSFPIKYLGMKHIPGSLHETLPELYRRLHEGS